jgi:ABC-type nitrate/sulfonate/bicarbonate transport system permease component
MRWIGYFWLPLLWIALKYGLHISERYLPDPWGVVTSATMVQPNILIHILFTTTRFTVGFIAGTAIGVMTGLMLYRSQTLRSLLMPVIQSSRSVPAVAIIPFFLLWFGFSEVGRYLLVLSGTALNIAIATLQIAQDSPERYVVMFKSFKLEASFFPLSYGVPYVFENILPTLRFSLASAIGLIVASEMLGSQIGLGYLAQSARSTFSLDLLFLTVILLGLISAIADEALIRTWRASLFWLR